MDLSIDPQETKAILTSFIKTYVENAGNNSVVLGLSGGVDSAVVALLCKEALGAKNVQCVFMPDETTPPTDTKHEQLLVKTFHLHCTEINIAPFVHSFQALHQRLRRMTIANIKPRVRMILLYEIANETGSIICGTSNKSEMLVGYFTKYGDGGVDFQPIGDLYKTQVCQLAHFLKIPKPIITKPPTAGLWLGQTDEKELKMNYSTLDKILYGLELKLKDVEIQREAGVTQTQVERIRTMRVKSQHKRRTPMIPKLGIRTPGIDWRSPVQEG
ncbi:MAG TPA: NAD+ synthase [Candidatus Thermoplasmatota archaeon]|nr:NAD+ synthase [Candidatus Thermoplasmatota archaeon]